MVEERDIWGEFIEKLDELTRDGVLQWTSKRPPEILRNDPARLVSITFETEHKDRKLRLYEARVSIGRPLIDPLRSLTGQENSPWRTDIVLEILDKNGASWEFPEIEGLSDLLEAVKYQVAGVNEYVEAVLAEETAKSR
jgi:hypothetical protein